MELVSTVLQLNKAKSHLVFRFGDLVTWRINDLRKKSFLIINEVD